MRPWIFWLLILAVIAGIACLKVGIHLYYKEQSFSMKLRIGPFQLKFGEKEKKHGKQKSGTAGGGKKKEQKLSWVDAVMNNWEELFALLGRILTAPTLDVLRLQIAVGGKDPADCALKYGKICAGVGALLAPLENTFSVAKRDVHVDCCFDRDKTDADGEAALSLRVYESIFLAVTIIRFGLKFYRDAKTNMKVV